MTRRIIEADIIEATDATTFAPVTHQGGDGRVSLSAEFFEEQLARASSNPITAIVGDGGSFSNLPSALEWMSTRRRSYATGGVSAQVVFSEGYEITNADRMDLRNIDLTWIVLNSVSPELTVVSGSGYFLLARNSKCPVWNIRINGAGLMSGVSLNENSEFRVGESSGRGFTHAAQDGIFINRLSRAYLHEARFHDAGRFGLFADRRAEAYARHIRLENAGSTCAKFRDSSIGNLNSSGTSSQQTLLTGAGGTAIEGNGLFADSTCIVDVRGADVSGGNRGIRNAGSWVYAQDIICTGVSSDGLLAIEQSHTYISGSMANCATAIQALNNSHVFIQGTMDLSNSSLNAISVQRGARVVGSTPNMSGAGRQSIIVRDSQSEVSLENVTYKHKQTLISLGSDAFPLLSENEQLRVRLQGGPSATRFTLNAKMTAGKDSSSSGRGGSIDYTVYGNVRGSGVGDLNVQENYRRVFGETDFEVVHVAGTRNFDLVIKNPGTGATFTDWFWALQIDAQATFDSSNQSGQIEFVSAAIEPIA